MKPIMRLLAAIFAIAAPAAAAAEVPSVPYNWRNVVIGGGGFSPNIIFSPAEKGLAYLRTDVGGVYRWDAQQQRWMPLEDNIWNDSYYGIESIAPVIGMVCEAENGVPESYRSMTPMLKRPIGVPMP